MTSLLHQNHLTKQNNCAIIDWGDIACIRCSLSKICYLPSAFIPAGRYSFLLFLNEYEIPPWNTFVYNFFKRKRIPANIFLWFWTIPGCRVYPRRLPVEATSCRRRLPVARPLSAKSPPWRWSTRRRMNTLQSKKAPMTAAHVGRWPGSSSIGMSKAPTE